MTTTSDPEFPKVLTAEMLKNFQTTERGCTHPRVGTINGHLFIAKCGSWSAHSSDKHVHNEYVADNLLRAAGLNVQFSREYKVDFGGGAVLSRGCRELLHRGGERGGRFCVRNSGSLGWGVGRNHVVHGSRLFSARSQLRRS